MERMEYPKYFADRAFSLEEAMAQTIKSGFTIGSGFGPSEPQTLYQRLWDYILKEDLHDLNIRHSLFMAPHRLCVGDSLDSKGLLADLIDNPTFSILANIARPVNRLTRQAEGVRHLVEHYRALKSRNIKFISNFIGATQNSLIPSDSVSSVRYPNYIGRNTTTVGVTDMHSLHYPDIFDSLGLNELSYPHIDTYAMVMTPPNEEGLMSHGPANSFNQDVLERVLAGCDINLLLFINPKYPFTHGYKNAPNTIKISKFRRLARAGRLFVVEDDGQIPCLPKGSFDHPSPAEMAIAERVVNHIEMNKDLTFGRSMQVGIGGTGVLAIKALKDTAWRGRCYTEMLEPFMYQLFEAGKIEGSHFIERRGTRTMLDGKMVCTFTICEAGNPFYDRLDNNPNVVIAAAERVVIPEAFYYGMGINNCLGIDFQGQVNSSARGINHHSGVGGGAQIIRGLARGGVGYLCLKSTFKTFDGKVRSSIMPLMPHGTPVNYTGPDIMGGREGARIFLVTEHGMVQISGRTQSQYIAAIISVADPRFKDWLTEQAYKLFRVRAAS